MPVTAQLQRAAGQAFARRESAGLMLAEDSDRVARVCQDMAVRFHHGGKLILFGNGSAGTDAAHIAVEFMHPAIVGKRALPALAVSNDATAITGVATREGFIEIFAHQVRHWAAPGDIALGISPDGRCLDVLRGLDAASAMGLLTIALTGGNSGSIRRNPAIEHVLTVRSTDPAVVKEVHVTTYHVLWELVHVFLEHPGLLGRQEDTSKGDGDGRD
jgi:D-sedoheptulose 7-phosphate isomerase